MLCHRCVYIETLHAGIARRVEEIGGMWVICGHCGCFMMIWGARLRLFYDAMGCKFAKGEEKKLHEPLAAMCAIEGGIMSLVEVVASGGKEWGATRCVGMGVFPSVDYTTIKFK